MAVFQDIMTGMRKESADIGMVLSVIGVLVTMILPIPPILLDFLLALNITLAIIVLITVTEKIETMMTFAKKNRISITAAPAQVRPKTGERFQGSRMMTPKAIIATVFTA